MKKLYGLTREELDEAMEEQVAAGAALAYAILAVVAVAAFALLAAFAPGMFL